jgi:hypothetical protein
MIRLPQAVIPHEASSEVMSLDLPVIQKFAVTTRLFRPMMGYELSE